jgi:hypothetical protein
VQAHREGSSANCRPHRPAPRSPRRPLLQAGSAVHAAPGRHCRSRGLILRCLGDHRFGGDQEAGPWWGR